MYFLNFQQNAFASFPVPRFFERNRHATRANQRPKISLNLNYIHAKERQTTTIPSPVSIDKFMSECRVLTNVIGNGVATIVVSRWENELDPDKLRQALAHPLENGETKSS